MIDVTNKVKILEINHSKPDKEAVIFVNSNWVSHNSIDLETDGVVMTINANDLKKAIDNALNVNRY